MWHYKDLRCVPSWRDGLYWLQLIQESQVVKMESVHTSRTYMRR